MLEGKTAVIYGGGGSIGGAVARAFAREGARVQVTGRTLESVQPLAQEIGAEAAVVDALDEAAIDAHAAAIGPLDISFNAISHGDVQGTPMHEMDVEDYLRPVVTAVRSTFLTMRAAARSMIAAGGGTILIFGGEGDPPRGYRLGGLQTASTRWRRCAASSRSSSDPPACA
jgi:NADP-dependent 3-hydroxy acid dehydrogenase YdfG